MLHLLQYPTDVERLAISQNRLYHQQIEQDVTEIYLNPLYRLLQEGKYHL